MKRVTNFSLIEFFLIYLFIFLINSNCNHLNDITFMANLVKASNHTC